MSLKSISAVASIVSSITASVMYLESIRLLHYKEGAISIKQMELQNATVELKNASASILRIEAQITSAFKKSEELK